MSHTLCVSVYSTPLIDAHPCATQFVPCPCVIYSLCPAPVSDTVLCPCVRHTLRQRQCVFHPCDRRSSLCHTVCALPLCYIQFVPCPCVRHCALPQCQMHFVSETVCIPPLWYTHPCATQFVSCPYVIHSLCLAPVSDIVLCPGVRRTLCQKSVYSTPVIDTHPCATQFVPCPRVGESLYCTPALDNCAGIDFILGLLHM